MKLIPRWMHHAYAGTFGYFWTDCPLCGTWFGGHEWRSYDGKPLSIPTGNPGEGTAICPACIKAGRGVSPLAIPCPGTGDSEED